jgi:hypothetical protein
MTRPPFLRGKSSSARLRASYFPISTSTLFKSPEAAGYYELRMNALRALTSARVIDLKNRRREFTEAPVLKPHCRCPHTDRHITSCVLRKKWLPINGLIRWEIVFAARSARKIWERIVWPLQLPSTTFNLATCIIILTKSFSFWTESDSPSPRNKTFGEQ